MRLAAVYIPQGILEHVFGKEHKGQTINFGGKFLYTIAEIKGKAILEKKEYNPNYVEGFWNPLVLMSTIVGANGTGKSSLLNIFRGRSFCSCIYENDENDEIKITSIEDAYQDFFYYTPHYELVYDGYENNNFRDISKFPLMVDDLDDERNDLTTLLELHFSENLKRWMKFSNEEFLEDSEINLPVFDSLKIKLNYISVQEHQTSYKFRDFFHHFKRIESEQRPIDEQKLFDEAGLDTAEKVKKSKITNQLRLRYEIISRVIAKTQNILEASGNKFLAEGFMNNDWTNESPNFVQVKNDLKQSFYLFLENAYVQISSKSEKIFLPKKEISGLIEALLKFLPSNEEIDNWTEMKVSQEAGLEILEAYEVFLLAFKEEFSFDKKILLSFSPNKRLSSGERGMYDLFSAFLDLNYRYKNKIADDYFKFGKKENLSDNITILLDEGDLGFHPHWKKRYVSFLIQILPKIFIDKNLQIIIATHDPLTLSDIPNNNIVYLAKRPDGCSYLLEGIMRPKHSFGANITDLLADSFFLNHSLMGDFAEGKINTLIVWLRSRSVDDKAYFRSLINLVDEPLLKYKLNQMYQEKFPDEIDQERARKEIEDIAKRSGIEVNFNDL